MDEEKNKIGECKGRRAFFVVICEAKSNSVKMLSSSQ